MKHALKLSAARPRGKYSPGNFNTCLLGNLIGLFFLLTIIFAGNARAAVSPKEGSPVPDHPTQFYKQSQETGVDRDFKEMFKFDPEWNGNGKSPFIEREMGFPLRKNIGGMSTFPNSMLFNGDV